MRAFAHKDIIFNLDGDRQENDLTKFAFLKRSL